MAVPGGIELVHEPHQHWKQQRQTDPRYTGVDLEHRFCRHDLERVHLHTLLFYSLIVGTNSSRLC